MDLLKANLRIQLYPKRSLFYLYVSRNNCYIYRTASSTDVNFLLQGRYTRRPGYGLPAAAVLFKMEQLRFKPGHFVREPVEFGEPRRRHSVLRRYVNIAFTYIRR